MHAQTQNNFSRDGAVESRSQLVELVAGGNKCRHMAGPWFHKNETNNRIIQLSVTVFVFRVLPNETQLDEYS